MTSKSSYILAAFNAEGGWTALLSGSLTPRLAELCQEATDWCTHLEFIGSIGDEAGPGALPIAELPMLIQHYSLLHRIVMASGRAASAQKSSDALINKMTKWMLDRWLDDDARLSDEAVLYHLNLFPQSAEDKEVETKRRRVLRGWIKKGRWTPQQLVVMLRINASILGDIAANPLALKHRISAASVSILTALDAYFDNTDMAVVDGSAPSEAHLLLLRTLGSTEMNQDLYDRLQLRLLSHFTNDASLPLTRRQAHQLDLTHTTRLLLQYIA